MEKNKNLEKQNNINSEKAKSGLKFNNSKILALGFALLSLVILLFCIFEKDKAFSEVENRTLQKFPKISVNAIVNGSFGEDFEKYAQDTVVLRDFWVKLKNTTEFVSLKKDNGSVYFGENGQLYGMEKINFPLFRKNIEAVKVPEENFGIRTKVLLAPTASLILKEKLPKNVPSYMQNSMMESTKELLGENFVDVREVLDRCQGEYIYYKTDHHWTSLGAYYAYTELAKSLGFEPLALESMERIKLSSDFEGTNAAKAATFFTKKDEIFAYVGEQAKNAEAFDTEGKKVPIFDESYLEKRDKYAYFLGGNLPFMVLQRKTDEREKIGNVKSILLIKDSYANCLAPMLLEHYHRVYVIDPRYYRKSIKQSISDIRYKDNIELSDIVVLYNAPQFSIDVNVSAVAR